MIHKFKYIIYILCVSTLFIGANFENKNKVNVVTILADDSVSGFSLKPDNMEEYVKDYLHVPFVYSGDFNYNIDNSLPDGVLNNRQYQTLGYEMFYKNIKVSKDGELVKTEFSSDEKVDAETAIMNIYKSIGMEEYVYSLKKLNLDENSEYIQNLKRVTPTEFINTNTDIEYDAYRLTVTNSSPNVYLRLAYRDGLILSNYNSKGNPTYEWISSVANLSEILTISEFCNLVYKAIDIYGESILTQKEQTLLIQTYGNKLPYYLDDESLKAVKYLTAKGIINWENEQYNFTNALTRDIMLDILCSVKDIDSRYTFKDIQLTLDNELVEKGYYETEILSMRSPIMSIDYNGSKIATTYYDYFIEPVDGVTTFTDKSNDLLYQYKVDVKGYEFLGIDENTGYYHFRIPKTRKNKLTFSISKYKFNISTGGGYYKYDRKSNSFINTPFDRSDFLSDKNGQIVAQENMEFPVFLDKSNQTSSIFILFNSEDEVKNVKILGTQLDLAKMKGKGQVIKNHRVKISKVSKSGVVTVSITNYESRSKLLSDLEVSSGYVSSYKAYCREGNQLLVNVNYLVSNGIVTNPIEIEKGVLFLSTQYSDIYLDKKNGYVVNGNIVSKSSKDDLLYYKDDSEYYVDYRAVMGWSGEFLRFVDSKGKMCVGLSKRDKEVKRREVYTALGFPQKSVKVASVDDKILLSSKNPLANYFIFKADSAYYLFVFHNTNGFKEHKASASKLKEITGLDLPKGMSVYLWRLTDNNSTKSVKGAWENPSGISFDKDYGFLYSPPEYSKFKTGIPSKNFKVKKNDPDNYPIQIVLSNKKFIDINLNTFSTENGDLEYGRVPKSYIDNKKSNKIVEFTLDGKFKDIKTYSNLKIIPSVTGVIDTFYSRKPWKVEEVRKTNHLLFYGTLPVYINGKKISLTTKKNSKEIMKTSETTKGFRLLRATTHNSYIFSIIQENMLEPITVSSSKGSNSSSLAKIGIDVGDTAGLFDWNSMNFRNNINTIDSIYNLILIFIISIIPRLAMFFFFTIIAFSLISNVKFFEKACDNFIDPVKILTLGRQNIHTVRTTKVLISSMLALAMFGLFMDGTILDVISYIQSLVLRLLQL